MSIASQITTMQEHIEDIYDTFAVAGVDTSAAAKNIVNINANLKERLEYYLANGLDVVWNNWNKVSGSGTALSLNNTIQAKMDFGYKGNTSQESTTGKNFLNVPSDYSVTGNTTINIILPAGTYHISCGKVVKGGANAPAFTGFGTWFYLDPNTDVTRTLNEATELTIRIYSNGYSAPDSTGVTSIINNLMISTSGEEYEPYTGGNPAPNPDYPMPVNVVTGDNEVKVEGKNLVDTSKSTLNKSIYASGTILNSPNINTTDYIYVGDKSSITISFTSNLSATWNTCYFDENKNVVAGGSNGLSITAGENGYIHTLSANQKYIRFSYPNDSQDVMLESGSSKTTFEPYTSQTYPINLGSMELCKIGDYQDRIFKSSGKNKLNASNLLVISNCTISNGVVTQTLADTNTIRFKLQTYMGNTKIDTIDTIDINSLGRYEIEFTYNSSSFDNLRFGLNGTQRDTTIKLINLDNLVDGTTYYLSVNFTNITQGSVSWRDMMISSTQNDTYEPYGTGKWYKYGAIGKVVLDGSETWTKYRDYLYYRDDNFELSPLTSSVIPNLMSNKFQIVNFNDLPNNANINMCANQIGDRNTQRGVCLYANDNYSDVATLKTWLSSNNVEVRYVLATPTITPITDTTLLSQLEAIKLSYNDQTNISQTNTDKPFILDVTALKDLDTEDTTPALTTNRGLLFTQPPVSENFINDEDDNSILEETINEEEPNIEDDNREEEEPVDFFEKEIINNDEEQEEIPTEPIEIDNGQR